MSVVNIPSGKISIPEIKFVERLEVAANGTALLITDMQNDFVKPKGRLVVADALATVAPIQTLLATARKAGAPIVFMQDTHIKNDKEFAIWPEHCVINTWGWQIVDELLPQANEVVLQKSRYDAFYGTALEYYLKGVWNVKRLIIVGTVSNICVLHTVGSASLRWLDVVVPVDGISALSEFDQVLTLHQISNLYYGQVVTACANISFK